MKAEHVIVFVLGRITNTITLFFRHRIFSHSAS